MKLGVPPTLLPPPAHCCLLLPPSPPPSLFPSTQPVLPVSWASFQKYLMHRQVKKYLHITILLEHLFLISSPLERIKDLLSSWSLKWGNEIRVSSLHSCKWQVYLFCGIIRLYPFRFRRDTEARSSSSVESQWSFLLHSVRHLSPWSFNCVGWTYGCPESTPILFYIFLYNLLADWLQIKLKGN